MSANYPFLNLRALDALKREKITADVIEYLNGMAVHGIDLATNLQQAFHWVRVCFRAAVFQRVYRKRIIQFSDYQRRAIRGHEIAINPDHIENNPKIWIGHLRECIPQQIEQTTA